MFLCCFLFLLFTFFFDIVCVYACRPVRRVFVCVVVVAPIQIMPSLCSLVCTCTCQSYCYDGLSLLALSLLLPLHEMSLFYVCDMFSCHIHFFFRTLLLMTICHGRYLQIPLLLLSLRCFCPIVSFK